MIRPYQNKGFTIQRDVINHRCQFKVVSCDLDSDSFITILKSMKLWFATEKEAQIKCDKVAEKYTKPLRSWGGKGNSK